MSCDCLAATWLVVHIRTLGTRKCDPFDQTPFLAGARRGGLGTRLIRHVHVATCTKHWPLQLIATIYWLSGTNLWGSTQIVQAYSQKVEWNLCLFPLPWEDDLATSCRMLYGKPLEGGIMLSMLMMVQQPFYQSIRSCVDLVLGMVVLRPPLEDMNKSCLLVLCLLLYISDAHVLVLAVYKWLNI